MPLIVESSKKYRNHKEKRWFCPSCGNKTLTTLYEETEGNKNGVLKNIYCIRRCTYCQKLSFLHYLLSLKRPGGRLGLGAGDSTRIDHIISAYPLRGLCDVEQLDLPKKIKHDYVESIKCLQAGCYKAACAMSRRTLQNIVLHFGARKKSKLKVQINQLAKKGVISNELREWAHDIRLVGNSGAHPLKDGFDVMTAEDAEEVQLFLQSFIDYAIVLRAKLDARKKKRTAKKKMAR